MDGDSLFSAFLGVRSRTVKEELTAPEGRVCHPGGFCFNKWFKNKEIAKQSGPKVRKRPSVSRIRT